MRVYALHEGSPTGPVVAYVADIDVAFGTVTNTYCAFEGLRVHRTPTRVTVKRPRFDDLDYCLEPIEVWQSAQHL